MKPRKGELISLIKESLDREDEDEKKDIAAGGEPWAQTPEMRALFAMMADNRRVVRAAGAEAIEAILADESL